MSTIEQTQQALRAGTWKADPVHSDLGFSIRYMAGTFRGSFTEFDIELTDGTLHGTAEVASVQVKDPALEAHLQSPEFFDAERHPQLSFSSHSVERSGDRVTIVGDVTIVGHTEPVRIRGTIGDPIRDPFGNERFGLRLATTIDRIRLGLTWNNPLPSGEPALANEVTIDADLQFVKSA